MDQRMMTICCLARHETFCPRYGWLKKGFDRVAGESGQPGDSGVFDRDEAIEILGVGKNMVRAIRFWCLAFKVIEPADGADPARISGPMQPTAFGRALLSETGWDSYLEDPASLWLLHWKLFTNPALATAWSLIANLNTLNAFTLKELTDALLEQRENHEALKRYSESSFHKDASCFIRMYHPDDKDAPDSSECPFTSLDLLTTGDAPHSVRFNLEDKPTLPDPIFLAACFEYAAQYADQAAAISLNRLVYGLNSPGVAFKLSETHVGNRLERAVPLLNGVLFTESFGNRQLQFETAPGALAQAMLTRYYQGAQSLNPD